MRKAEMVVTPKMAIKPKSASAVAAPSATAMLAIKRSVKLRRMR